jgi:two-component system, cell cycle sensor histidine kinase and response regulator CckA
MMSRGDDVLPEPSGAGNVGSILVVDDEPTVRRFASRVLREAGYGVKEAVDGVEALSLIRSGVDDLDAVVSDIVMPRMNGVDLVRSLALEHPRLPVILMSGYDMDHLSRLGIVSPCGVLSKPFPPARLLAEVRRCLSLEASGPGT